MLFHEGKYIFNYETTIITALALMLKLTAKHVEPVMGIPKRTKTIKLGTFFRIDISNNFAF